MHAVCRRLLQQAARVEALARQRVPADSRRRDRGSDRPRLRLRATADPADQGTGQRDRQQSSQGSSLTLSSIHSLIRTHFNQLLVLLQSITRLTVCLTQEELEQVVKVEKGRAVAQVLSLSLSLISPRRHYSHRLQMYGLGAPWTNDNHPKFNRGHVCGEVSNARVMLVTVLC
jgi:hypothetical protein